MPFAYKFSFSYPEMREFLDSATGRAYIDAFQPKRQLLLYEKGGRSKPPVYLVTDIDLFPPLQTNLFVKMRFSALDQEAFNELCYNLSHFITEGDLSLVGGDDFNGQPPIFGDLN